MNPDDEPSHSVWFDVLLFVLLLLGILMARKRDDDDF